MFNNLRFTGISDITVWQDVVVSAFIIPLAFYVFKKIIFLIDSLIPSKQILDGYTRENDGVLIFHSQMSGADDNGVFNPNQKYITQYPAPLPSNRGNMKQQNKLNIDPVLSQAEMECLTDIYSLLGSIGKVSNVRTGDLIKDWNDWSSPMFSVGFNPKTHELIKKCDPISFTLLSNELKLSKFQYTLNSLNYNDAGVIQKTFQKGTNVPVIILAGLGTTGTSSSGLIFKQNIIGLGKLYGKDPFCVFIKANIQSGRTASSIDKIFPKPKFFNIILHPITYYRFNSKLYFQYT